MNTNRLHQIANITRPLLRRKRPIVSRLCKRVLRRIYPPPQPGQGHELLTHYDGGTVHIDTSSSLEYQLLFHGCHEPCMAHLLGELIQPGYVCLDVGANIGAHTLVMAAATGPTGRVLAFEPHPALCERLRANVQLNKYDHVKVIEAALSDEDGTATFYSFDETSSTQSTSSLRPNKDAQKAMTVQTMSGATLETQEKLDTCDLIKIDVEGAETVVLTGIEGLIKRTLPYVTFEYRARLWRNFEGNIEHVVQQFQSLGYTLYAIGSQTLRPVSGPPPDHSDVLCVPQNRPVPPI